MSTTSFNNPYLNQPMANSGRQPRAVVTVNGITVKWIDIEVITNHFYVSDTFSIDLPLTGQPEQLTEEYWTLAGLLEIRIYIGFPSDPNSYSSQNLPLFMTGDVTDFTMDPVMRTIRIHGRDLSSRLIDKKLTQGYTNLTLSQIAQQFAADANLSANIELTTQKVGIFYKNELTIISNNSTQWDLLTALAQLQNFVVYVNNDTLVCISRQASQSGPAYQLNFQNATNPDLASSIVSSTDITESINVDQGSQFPTFNGMNLTLSRTPYSDVSVTVVVPYSPQSKQFLFVTAVSSNRSRDLSGLPAAPVRKFVHKYFGLTRQQAQLKANQLLSSYLIHEFEINADLPGDNLLLKNSLIKLSGTGTEFDQIYFPDEIVRRINMNEGSEGGYSMTVNAKSYESQTVIS